jgi:hypothetical protein
MRKKKLEVYQAAVKLARFGKERDWKSIQEKLVEAIPSRSRSFGQRRDQGHFEHLLGERPQISKIASRCQRQSSSETLRLEML